MRVGGREVRKWRIGRRPESSSEGSVSKRLWGRKRDLFKAFWLDMISCTKEVRWEDGSGAWRVEKLCIRTVS